MRFSEKLTSLIYLLFQLIYRDIYAELKMCIFNKRTVSVKRH